MKIPEILDNYYSLLPTAGKPTRNHNEMTKNIRSTVLNRGRISIVVIKRHASIVAIISSKIACWLLPLGSRKNYRRCKGWSRPFL